MAVSVKIPTPLRRYTDGSDVVEVEGATIKAVFDALGSKHPDLMSRLTDDSGKVRRFVNVYANQDDIRFLDNMETQVSDGDEISIIPAIAGGQ